MRWHDGRLSIIDQTLLPEKAEYAELNTVEAVFDAIRALKVRGAPAIGCCAAYGVLVGVSESDADTPEAIAQAASAAGERLAASRPTAVNLFWAIERMTRAAERAALAVDAKAARALLEHEAAAIFATERETCRRIGEAGQHLIAEGAGVLTHCNAGALATVGMGTALAPMFSAHAAGRRFHVFADETRPLLQGARLTAWELVRAEIPVTLICDNTAAQVMREGRIQVIIVGADRIAANGDTANKIGTYSVAVLAQAHGIPFYVAAPLSTFDCSLATGAEIPIEERDPAEVTHGFGRPTAPGGVRVYSPAFDVTPAEYISGIITDAGILRPPFMESIARAKSAGSGAAP